MRGLRGLVSFNRFSVDRGQDWFGFKINSRLIQFGKFSRITGRRGVTGRSGLSGVGVDWNFLGVNFGWFEVDIT